MKAIIVPGVTDLNKGDQALVWESYRLAKDTGLYDEIYILDSGDTAEERDLLCRQSEENGFLLLNNILPHPRRGKHNAHEHIRESNFQLLKQVNNAAIDLISSWSLINICGDLKKVKRYFGEKTYSTLEKFHQVQTVFVKGGGFIHAYGEKTAPYLMWYFLFYVRLAKALKKNVVFLPNSFGPFEGFTVKRQVKSVLSKVDLIYAREYVSAESLGNLLEKNIPVEMDLGFFLEESKDDEVSHILVKYNLTPSDKIVGITIRPWRFPGKPNPEELYEKYLKSIEVLATHILAKGYKVALCNQSLGPNAHEDDRNAIRELLSRVTHPNLIWIDENLSCRVLKAIYSNFYFFIGTRFHSIIFSLTSLVPSIAIGYGGNKANGIMRGFNLDKFVIPIDKTDPNMLVNLFEEAIEEYDSVKASLAESMNLVEKSRERLIKNIRDLYS